MAAEYDIRVDWDGDGGLSRLGDWDRWFPGGSVPGTLAPSTVRYHSPPNSLLLTWGAGGVLPGFGYNWDGLTPGVIYTLHGWVYVPTGSIDVSWAVAGDGIGATSTVKNAWTEIMMSFTATATGHLILIFPGSAPSGGEQVWLDEPTIQQAEAENVTCNVIDRGVPWMIRMGRDKERVLSPMAPGRAQVELDNTTRDYSPDNASSPLAGNVLPGREVRMRATLNGTVYSLMRGHLDDFEILPDLENRSVQITCLDVFDRFHSVAIRTEVHESVRTGEAVHIILDAAGWPTWQRDIDLGVTGIPWLWFEDVDAFTALQQVVDSEGPPALLTVDADGNVVFRDRHHRLLRPASSTVQATFTDVELSPPVIYDHGLRNIVNSVEYTIPVYKQGGGVLAVVWSSEEIITFSAGQTRKLRVRASSAFVDARTPVAGTDYTLLSGAIEITLSRTSGESTDIIMTASSVSQISQLQLRAVPLIRFDTVVKAEDSASVGRYGRRSVPAERNPVWASLADADAIADLVIGHYADRLPTITATLRGGDDVLPQQLSRDLSDRVHITETETGLDADCFIETIEHTIADLSHTTLFGCEKAPVPVTNVFMFNVTGRGFDDGRFGQIGQNDADAMFLFDVAGRGFDDGLLAY